MVNGLVLMTSYWDSCVDGLGLRLVVRPDEKKAQLGRGIRRLGAIFFGSFVLLILVAGGVRGFLFACAVVRFVVHGERKMRGW